MAVQRIAGLHDEFQAQALKIRAALGDSSECLVNFMIYYGLPDAPNLLGEFFHQRADVFEPGRDVITAIEGFETRVQAAKGITELVGIYDDWATFAMQLDRQWNDEKWKFTKPTTMRFSNTLSRAEMPAIIAKIPFPGMRKFLTHWNETIQGDPKELGIDAMIGHPAAKGVAKNTPAGGGSFTPATIVSLTAH